MTLGLKIAVRGPDVAPNHALELSQHDDVDDAAVLFGDRLLMSVDPRKVRKMRDNPSGRKRIHYLAPNRDALLFSGSGVAVEPIAGKYDGRPVFGFTRTGTAAAGTHNDLRVLPKTMNSVTSFSAFGVAHIDASNNGGGTVKALLAMVRAGASFESLFCHQYAAGVNYLSIFADQGDSGGLNHNLDTSTVIAAGVPFFYLFRVTASRISLFVNDLTTPLIDGAATGVPETGLIEVCIGNACKIDDARQLAGGHGRLYLVQGDALDTEDNRNVSLDLMNQMKNHYNIA